MKLKSIKFKDLDDEAPVYLVDNDNDGQLAFMGTKQSFIKDPKGYIQDVLVSEPDYCNGDVNKAFRVLVKGLPDSWCDEQSFLTVVDGRIFNLKA